MGNTPLGIISRTAVPPERISNRVEPLVKSEAAMSSLGNTHRRFFFMLPSISFTHSEFSFHEFLYLRVNLMRSIVPSSTCPVASLRLVVRLSVAVLLLSAPSNFMGVIAGESLSSPPNVVLILSDDQAWGDYGFMGHPVIQTPHLDRLAARSVLFRRGYTPVPLCRPSLMSMITGLYPHQHGVTGNDPKPDRSASQSEMAARREALISRIDSLKTLPAILAEHGYVSFQSGKWWEGNFRRGGFTEGMTRGFPQPGGRHGDDGLSIGRSTMQPVTDFVTRAVAAKQPFFLWYAPMLPHTPHDPPARLLQKYQADDRPLPLAKYYAMCELFDETCGILMNHLEQQGIAENTLVMYVTDNGWIQATPDMNLGPAWNHGFAPRSKQTVYEGGVRTPIMISLPGRIDPADRPELASTLDVFPTVLSAAGILPPEGLPGVDWWSAIVRDQPVERAFVAGESFSHDIADMDHHETTLQYRWCVEGAWKLILSFETEPDRYSFVHEVNERVPQLFNIVDDPHETRNAADEHPDVVARLTERIFSVWRTEKTPVGLSEK